jgi:hypothetical protein
MRIGGGLLRRFGRWIRGGRFSNVNYAAIAHISGCGKEMISTI